MNQTDFERRLADPERWRQRTAEQLSQEYGDALKMEYDWRIFGDRDYAYVVPVDSQTLRTIERFSHTDGRFRSVAGLMLTAAESARQFMEQGKFPRVLFVQNYIVYGRRLTSALERYRAEVLMHVRRLKPRLLAGNRGAQTERELIQSVSIYVHSVHNVAILVPNRWQYRMGYHLVDAEEKQRRFVSLLGAIPSEEPLALGVMNAHGAVTTLTLVETRVAVNRWATGTPERPLMGARVLYSHLAIPQDLLRRVVGRDLPVDSRALGALATAVLSLEALRRQPQVTGYDLHELTLAYGAEATGAMSRNILDCQEMAGYYEELMRGEAKEIATLGLGVSTSDSAHTYAEMLVYDYAVQRAQLARTQERLAAESKDFTAEEVTAKDDLPLFDFCQQSGALHRRAMASAGRIAGKKLVERPSLLQNLGACLIMEWHNLLWLDTDARDGQCWTHVQLGG